MFWKRFYCCLLLCLFLTACIAGNQQADGPKQQAEIHYKMGVSHLQANNPTMALKEFLTAVEIDPKNSSIHAVLAQAYQLKKAYQQAESHYLKALELSENDPRYQNNLGALYLDMQQWDKAIEYFDKAAANLLFLNSHVALTGKAFAYYKKNDLNSAMQYYREAISIAPSYAQAHFLISEVYHDQGRKELERRSLERAIEIAPQYAQAHYQLGVLLLAEKEQKEEAVMHLKKVLEIAPDSEWGDKAAELLRSMAKS